MAAAAIPLIGSVAGGLLGLSGAGRAAKAVKDSQIAAEHGVLGAGADAQGRVENAYANAHDALESSNQVGQAKVNEATGTANDTLQKAYGDQTAVLDPYLTAGAKGVSSLSDWATNRPAFSFNPTDLQNEPGYKFQLDQGTAALNNSASSRGLLQSGNTLQDLTKFGQGLAGTYYNDAFKRALDTFNTNQNSTLQNLSTLAGIGLSGTREFNQASQNNANQQAQNTQREGYFGGQSDIDVSKFLSSLGLNAAQTEGLFGTTAAKQAGDYAVGAGNATGAGILGQTGAELGGLNGILNTIQQLIAAKGVGGGSVATSPWAGSTGEVT